MEVRKGYKQTEIGVIPVDWELCSLSDAVEFLDGKRRPIKSGDRSKIKGIYPYYGASGIIDYVNDFIFDEELILLGEDGENILSRNLPLAFKVNGKIWVNNHAHVLKPKQDFKIDYLTNYLESLDYSLLNSGTAQPKLNKQNCEKVIIKKPPLKEQTAIANALSDTDVWINSLEQLLIKKRLIKQGAMQELLQPKEGWEVKTIKQIVSTPVTDGPHETPQFIKNGVPFLSVNNIINNEISWQDLRYISKKDDERFSLKCKPIKNDILLGKAASVGKVALVKIDKDFNIWSPLALIRTKKEYDSSFLFYLLQTESTNIQISYFTNSSSQGNIGMGDIEKISFSFPEQNEQTRIATILSDMDEELAQLETKLAKAKQIKQGMMQELLTGRIRLV